MEHSGLGSVMWVFGTRSSHRLRRKPRPAGGRHWASFKPVAVASRRVGKTGAYAGRLLLFHEPQLRRWDARRRGREHQCPLRRLVVQGPARPS